MRRTILAILAGAVTSGAAAVACGPLDVYDHTQETVEWMMQRAWPDPAFVGVLHMTIGLLIGLPGVVVAVWIARRRPYPRGHCRRCGYNLTGNTSGVCPECGRLFDERVQRILDLDTGDSGPPNSDS